MLRRQPAIVIFLSNISLQVVIITGYVCGPTFQRVFGLSDTQLGVSLGAVSMGVLLASAGVGHITHRWGVFRILMAGLAGTMAGLSGIVFATDFWMLLISLAIIGISAAFMRNSLDTFTAELFRDRLRQFVAIASGLWFGSSAIWAPAAGAWLELAKDKGWSILSFRIPYLVGILLVGFCLLFVYKYIRQPVKALRQRSKTESEQYREPAQSEGQNKQSMLWPMLIGFGHGLMIVPLLAWINPMVQEKFDVNEFKGSLIIAVISLTLAVGRILLALVKPSRDDRVILAISCISGGLILAIGLSMSRYTTTLFVIGIAGFLISTSAPCYLSLIGSKFSHKKSHIYGYSGSCIALAGLIGPSIVGWLADFNIPISKALWISPIAALAIGLISLAWKITERNHIQTVN